MTIWIMSIPKIGSRIRGWALSGQGAVASPFCTGRQARRYPVRCRSLYACPHHPVNGYESGEWRCWSLAEVVKKGDLDLRDQQHARQLEAVISEMDVERLMA